MSLHIYSLFEAVTLAVTFASSRRLTTFTIPRVIPLHCCPGATRTTLRLYSSRDIKRGTKQKSVSLLSGLLSKDDLAEVHREAGLGKEELVKASFAPKVRRYAEPERTPTDRWRRRTTLGPGQRLNLEDEASAATQFYKARGAAIKGKEEVAWTIERLAQLQRPDQGKRIAKEYRKHDYVRKDKMRAWAQILTTPTADTPGTTLLLHYDNKRYLVGALAEGTQRACVQMGARLLKVQECFLTGRTEWKNTGGLIGMILTLADSVSSSRESSVEDAVAKAIAKGKKKGWEEGGPEMRAAVAEARRGVSDATLAVFGPPNLNHSLATARRFVFRKGMPVDLHEIREDRPQREGEDEWAPYWADENIKVWAMSISPEREASRPGTASSVSPRKRSIDEVYAAERTDTAPSNGTAAPSFVDPDKISQADKDYLTTKAVVSEMFNSSWRLDTLHETPLSRVNLPASIFVRNPETKKTEKYTGPLPGSGKHIPDPNMTVLVRKPWPGALVESLPPTTPKKEAISYIIKNHTQRGKFNPEKAKELKVQHGPKFAQLTRGESVLNMNGETITPDMVLGEQRQGQGLAVVELPDASYIDGLIGRAEWKEESVMAGVGAIVWSCGEGVMNDPRIQNFLIERPYLEHIISSPDHCPNRISLDSVAAATLRLGKVVPGRFNVPTHEDRPKTTAVPINAIVAERGLKVQLEPKLEVQTDEVVPKLDLAEVEKDLSEEVLEEAAKAQQAATDSASDPAIEAWKTSVPNPDAEVITLGTGSALPSKYRNVSSTLVRVPGWGNILLDAGENTLGQLKRVFDKEELGQVLQDLRILFISHMHADHHLGTVAVLKAWYSEVHDCQPALTQDPNTPVQDLLAEGQPRRLAVISEPAMQQWLLEYAALEDYGHSRLIPLYISRANLHTGEPSKLGWFLPPSSLANLGRQEVNARLAAREISPSLIGLQDAQAVSVVHCHGALAVSLTLPSGFKVSYSGDCRPSKAFAQIGKGSTVCIHEATFDDELSGDAKAKNHSTTSEALGVAQGMGARACVLTHFSQRYQKMPVLEHTNDHNSNAAEEAVAAPDEEEEPEDAANEGAEFGPVDAMMQTLPDQPGTGEKPLHPPEHTEPQPQQQSYKPPTLDEPSHHPADQSSAAVRFKLTTDMKVAVAFDYFRVRVGDIWQMEKFTPALIKLFADETRKNEERARAAEAEMVGKSGKKKGTPKKDPGVRKAEQREMKVRGKGSREGLGRRGSRSPERRSEKSPERGGV